MPEQSANPPERLAIVGCYGRMGAMFCRCWQHAGYAIAGIDIPLTDSSVADALHGAKAVILCIPAYAIQKTLQKIVPYMDGTQILLDITSVKMRPLQQMDAAYKGSVIGTHPLFGPNPKHADLRVCITPGKHVSEEALIFAEHLYEKLGCRVFRSTAEEHDRAVADIQGLNFITTVAYFSTLAHRRELLPYLTPSFLRRLEAARKMLTEDAALFEWLFEANPLSQEAVRRYRSFLNVAAGGDVSILVQHTRWWWEQNPDQTMDSSPLKKHVVRKILQEK